MAAKDEDLPRATPGGKDPYEIEWPDDAKEMRAAERDKAARAARITPAPRWLTAAAIGNGMVLLFIAVVSIFGGTLAPLITFAWPIVAAGTILALPIGLILDRVSRNWRKGLPELAFLIAGIAIGVGWTHAGLIMLESITEQSLASSPDAFAFMRSVAGVFMGTATASAFMAAKFWTDKLRYTPPAVYTMTGGIVLITAVSVATFVSN